MKTSRSMKWVAFCIGAVIALYGLLLLTTALSGPANAGHTPLTLSGVSALAASAPFLALPFSLRAAKTLLALVPLMFGAGMLWLAFGRQHSAASDVWFNAAAVGLTVILLIHLGVAWRRGSRRPSA